MAIPEMITLDKEDAVVDEESHLLPLEDRPTTTKGLLTTEQQQQHQEPNGHATNHHHPLTNGHATTSSPTTANGPSMKPMDHLVSNRRKNLCWSVSLLIVFLGLIGSLAVWRYQDLSQASSAASATTSPSIGNWPNDDSSGNSNTNDSDNRAAHARQVLNKHFNRQSNLMAPGCEATIMIIRHCDKYGPNVYDQDGNEHCSYQGMERSHFLKTLFAKPMDNNSIENDTPNWRWPLPSYLFALTADRGSHLNFRERETLHPLSIQSGLDIEMMDPNDMPPRLFDMLQSGDMCGRLAVVCWKHELIPDLAVALGCGQEQGCPAVYPRETFDQVWQIKYVFRPSLVASTVASTSNSTNSSVSTAANGDQQVNAAVSASVNNDNNIDDDDDNTSTENNSINDGSGTAGGSNDDDDDDTAKNNSGSRFLKKHKQHHSNKRANDGWFVYASVQHQHFDPLTYSAQMGDYPPGGTPQGGRWKDEL